ncbi:MAG: ATP-binding protein, partial [Bacteroidota bacterium]
SKPVGASNRLAANEAVEFLHYLPATPERGKVRALYRLSPGDSIFRATPVPQINDKQVNYLYKTGTGYFIKDFRVNLFQFNLTDSIVTDFNQLVSDKFPSLNQFKDRISNVFYDKSGVIWLMTERNGVFKVSSNKILAGSLLPQKKQLSILSLSIFDSNNEASELDFKDLNNKHKKIVIPPKSNGFALEVFLPEYLASNAHLYSWRLEGFDRKWSEPSNANRISYAQLPPGKFTLLVKGQENSSGIVVERAFEVLVKQLWYRSWLAYGLYVALLGLLILLIGQYILNKRLEKAEAVKLRELDQLKTRLYTNITHEFRTPLTVIMGMTNNIKGHSKEKQLINRNSKNLLRLVNQLLDLAKLDAGTLKTNKVQADIVSYLQYISESFYSMAEEKNIKLVFYPEIEKLVMDFDETKIQHIVYNLLSNALKFTSDGGKVIFHLQKLEAANQDYLQLKIMDTGIGISKENLPKVFDRFYQGDLSSTNHAEGTGIGLALTKELNEMMNGTINIESELGKGTKVRVILPINVAANTLTDKEDHLSTSSQEAQEEPIVPFLDLHTFNKNASTPSLLIIEDNKDVITYIETLLKKDYHIEIARNGQEGIDKALEMIPDVIISDV